LKQAKCGKCYQPNAGWWNRDIKWTASAVGPTMNIYIDPTCYAHKLQTL